MEPLLVSTGLIFVSVTLVFFASLFIRSNSIIDVAYGLIFILVAVATFGLYSSTLPVQALVTILVIIWGVRLSARIYIKNKGRGEDHRYAQWRDAWLKKGKFYFWARSYFQVYLLQGIVIWIVSLPVVLINSDTGMVWNLFVSLGVFVWLLGFLCEVVADWQLDRFLQNPDNHGRVMQQGLFAYSRRPNYFGESLMWWGIALIAFSNPVYWVVFLSPAVITYILVAITGPITEHIWVESEEYKRYTERVSYFIPWVPRKQR